MLVLSLKWAVVVVFIQPAHLELNSLYRGKKVDMINVRSAPDWSGMDSDIRRAPDWSGMNSEKERKNHKYISYLCFTRLE